MRDPPKCLEKVLLREACRSSSMMGSVLDAVPLKTGKNIHLAAPIEDELLLGIDFIKPNAGVIDLREDTRTLGNDVIAAELKYQVRRLLLDCSVVVSPHTLVQTHVRFRSRHRTSFLCC